MFNGNGSVNRKKIPCCTEVKGSRVYLYIDSEVGTESHSLTRPPLPCVYTDSAVGTESHFSDETTVAVCLLKSAALPPPCVSALSAPSIRCVD